MPQAQAPPLPAEIAVPVITPPKLPTTWEKTFPKLIILVGGMLGAAGTFYSTEVAKDPETKEVVGTNVDIGAVLTALAGTASTIAGIFLQASNTKKAEEAATHATNTANTAVAVMASTPPIGSDGQMSVENTLNSALVQACQARRLKDANKILAMIGALEEGGVA